MTHEEPPRDRVTVTVSWSLVAVLAVFTAFKLHSDFQTLPAFSTAADYSHTRSGVGWEDHGNTSYYFNHADRVFATVIPDTNDDTVFKVFYDDCGSTQTNSKDLDYRTREAAERAVEEDCAEDGTFTGKESQP